MTDDRWSLTDKHQALRFTLSALNADRFPFSLIEIIPGDQRNQRFSHVNIISEYIGKRYLK